MPCRPSIKSSNLSSIQPLVAARNQGQKSFREVAFKTVRYRQGSDGTEGNTEDHQHGRRQNGERGRWPYRQDHHRREEYQDDAIDDALHDDRAEGSDSAEPFTSANCVRPAKLPGAAGYQIVDHRTRHDDAEQTGRRNGLKRRKQKAPADSPHPPCQGLQAHYGQEQPVFDVGHAVGEAVDVHPNVKHRQEEGGDGDTYQRGAPLGAPSVRGPSAARVAAESRLSAPAMPPDMYVNDARATTDAYRWRCHRPMTSQGYHTIEEGVKSNVVDRVTRFPVGKGRRIPPSARTIKAQR